MRTAWIISEGSPGHVSQTTGVVDSLAEAVSLEKRVFTTRPRFGGTGRILVRAWIGSQPKRLPDWFLRRCLQLEPMPGGNHRPDLIIASGGKSVFAGQSLAAEHGSPFVFLGERKPYPSEWFHTVFTPSTGEQGLNDLHLEMIPTQVTPGSVEAAARQWTDRPAGPLWSIIIGGTSVSHRFAQGDWIALAEAIQKLSEIHGIRWLLTTSRRTGREVENLLRARIPPSCLAKSVWWGTKPEKVVGAMLGASERVFVTQDSVTMVTEAVASARPVYVLAPADLRYPSGSFLPGYYANLARSRRICQVPMRQLSTTSVDKLEFQLRTEPVNQEIASRLLQRLGWK